MMMGVDHCEVEEIDFNRCFPWIKVTIKFLQSVNYSCPHNLIPADLIRTRRNLADSCCKDCYLRLFKNSHNLVEAVLRMYETCKNVALFEKYEKQLRTRCKGDSMKKHTNKVGSGGGGSGAEDANTATSSFAKTRKVCKKYKGVIFT